MKNHHLRDIQRSTVLREIAFYPGIQCTECQRTDKLTFHHVDSSTKVSAISDMIYEGVALKVLQDELLKCVCLCWSCHKKYHRGKTMPKEASPQNIRG